jgi:dihydrodipicolinate synthase/N-acetylneuraminate lyase
MGTNTGFEGVFAATITPYSASGAVDGPAAGRLAANLVESGLAGVCPCGSTGEFPLLSLDERALVNASAAGAVGRKGAVVAGVWGWTLAERRALVEAAGKSGASAVFLTVPIYFPASESAMVDWYRAIRRMTGLPLFAYSIPQFAGNEVPVEALALLASEGTIQGFKDSSRDPRRLEQVASRLAGKLALFAGNEALFPEALRMGFGSMISGLANVFPKTVVAVWKREPGAADRLAAIHAVVRLHGGIHAFKHLSGLRGFPAGPAREPIPPLSDADRSALDALFREFGEK